MGDILIPVLADSILSTDYMCAYFLELCDTPTFTKYFAADYATALLATKPASLADNNYVNSLYDIIKADPNPRPTYKAVQISDVHIDFYYEIGSNSDCHDYLCCRAESGLPADPSKAAG
jgi:hypothetical protein